MIEIETTQAQMFLERVSLELSGMEVEPRLTTSPRPWSAHSHVTENLLRGLWRRDEISKGLGVTHQSQCSRDVSTKGWLALASPR